MTTAAPASASQQGVLDLRPQAVRETQSQIAGIVAEIQAASRTYTDREAFFALTVQRLSDAMGCRGAALWRREASGTWSCVRSTALPADLSAIDQLDPLLSAIAVENQPILVPPAANDDAAAGDNAPSNPLPAGLVFAPVHNRRDVTSEGRANLLLAAIDPPPGSTAAQRGYLRFVQQIADLVSDFLRHCDWRSLHQKQAAIEQISDLLEHLRQLRGEPAETDRRSDANRLPTGETAALLAATARYAAADLAVLLINGRRPAIIDQWGKPALTDRSPAAVRLLAFAAEQSGDVDTPPIRLESIDANQTAGSLGELLGCRVWAGIDLRTRSSGRTDRSRAMIFLAWQEQPSGQSDGQIFDQLRVLLPPLQLAAALIDHPDLPTPIAARTWRRRLINVMSGPLRTASLLVALAAACCIPVPLQVTAPATLWPAEYRYLLAPQTAVVETVAVHYGQHVQAGELLARLQSDELEDAEAELMARLTENRVRRQTLADRIVRQQDLPAAEADAIHAETQALLAVEPVLLRRLELVRSQLADLEIYAPIDGVVATWQPHTLCGRRLVAGEPLLEVYQPAGQWHAQVSLRPADAALLGGESPAFVENASQWRVRIDGDPQRWWPVNTMPRSPLVVHHSDEGDVVPVAMPVALPADLRPLPGATATAATSLGHRPVGWVLCRDAALRLWSHLRLWI